jgi:hypothetical protein
MWDEESVISDYNSNLILTHIDTYPEYYQFKNTLKIRVSINSQYSGYDYFYLTTEEIKSIIETLKKMHQTLKGRCKIKNMELYSKSFFKLDMVDHGHVSITGQFGSIKDDDYLKFKIYADQTIIPRLIQILIDMMRE